MIIRSHELLRSQPNKRMHATRDPTAFKFLNGAGGRVMRGVGLRRQTTLENYIDAIRRRSSAE